ncbi:hypothetical protein MASR1M32_12880 [Rhodobacter sp.]
MAAILTIVAGFFGLLVGAVSLLLGGTVLTALLLWTSVAVVATILGLVWSMIPHAAPVRA